MLNINVPLPIRRSLGVFNVLWDSQNPLFSFTFQLIINFKIFVDDIDDRFYSITLVNSWGFMKNEKCHFLRENFIVFTKILNDIKILSLEVNDFRHESIIPHAFVLHIIELITVLDKKSHKLKWVLKLCRVVIVSHWVFLFRSCEGRLILKNEIQNLFNHHVLFTISAHKTVVLDQIQPYLEVLFESVPMFSNLIAHHFSILFQKL